MSWHFPPGSLPGKALPDVRYFRHDPAPDGKQPDNPLSVRLMRPADFSPTAPHLWCLPYPSKLPFHPKSDKNYKTLHVELHTGSRTGQSSYHLLRYTLLLLKLLHSFFLPLFLFLFMYYDAYISFSSSRSKSSGLI